MGNVKLLGMLLSIVFLSAFTINSSTVWNIEEAYSIKFSTKKAKGSFKTFHGDISFDADKLESSKFDVQIEVASIKTGNFLKNRHAKSDKWFDSENYPTINFVSESFNKTATGYEVSGTLDMHGIKKQIVMPFTFEQNVFKSSFEVNRTDFNIGATTGMSKSVGHEITLDIAVPVSN